MTEAVLEAVATPVKKSNHRANIVRITQILPHNNADNLEIIPIDGYQVVTRKGEFKIGDLGVYIQPDSVVPQTEPFKFIWEQFVGLDGTVPEKRRRITVRKFRGEWSEGLLLPLSEFTHLVHGNGMNRETTETLFVYAGDDVSESIGVTHYDPDAGVEPTKGKSVHAPRRKRPKTLRGWFYLLLSKLGLRGAHKTYSQEVSFHLPEYDVEAFKNHKDTFIEGEAVFVTEKIHGSNARFVCIDGTMYAGSRTQWKSPDSNCVWRKALDQNPWIEEWCRAHEGYALYGEVTPTQKGFDYGCKKDQVRFFVFDVLDPAGKWASPNEWEALNILMYQTVPVLYWGPFDKERILSLVDGQSRVFTEHLQGADHIREGIVVKAIEDRRVRGLGRPQLKIVSNKFLEKDSK